MKSPYDYTIYIDESCHLENDGQPLMCIGYTKIASKNYQAYKDSLKKLKLKYKSPTEIKWNKLSHSRIDLYKSLIDFFFENDIQFRAILVKNKNQLDHEKYNRGDHNAFYYTLVYLLLRNPYVNYIESPHKVILDIKDTRGKERLNKLDLRLNQEYQNKYNRESPFNFFQHIRSDENEFLQLADFFIGAITYKARKLHKNVGASEVKKEIVSYLEKRSGYLLNDGTPPFEEKFNIFDFQIQTKE
ncbi:DUF3800 domain-containing protein [Muricauda sp. 334s03]|uniref:DUF3800 domain-containing protein n=1 Tax=Flagellimonas yonaguniensis TaxID=3031325 RepID=A0ABT5XUH9_9FLAO|nr:DUF3800 domain-containing protein [[Muricauda] yonaguniensis]MDF0714842.1 DUF3800 domain-containing protein [[Muricauda] yonaguniensis]